MSDYQTKSETSSGHLSHPTDEEWMDWLYGELAPDKQSTLQAHLAHCDHCESRLSRWRGALKNLDGWQITPTAKERSRRTWPAALAGLTRNWAAAAILLVGVGLLLHSANSATLRASLDKRLEQQVTAARADLAATFAAATATNRAQLEALVAQVTASTDRDRSTDHQAILAALRELDAKWLAVYGSLRRELETVAVLTETELNDTQQQLVELATFNQTKP